MTDQNPAPPTVRQIADFLTERLGITDSVPLLWRVPERSEGDTQPVRRIGLALDENHDFAYALPLDALFLHRPFHLDQETLPETVILAVHKGFDDTLCVGYNDVLAAVFGLENVAPLFRSEARIGMVGEIAAAPWQNVRARLLEEFGGAEQVDENGVSEIVERIAFMGAMTPELVAQAADGGVTVYVTGQFRPGARAMAVERNVAIVAVGHRNAELWGLRQLARELARAFPGLEEIRVFTETRANRV